MSTTNKNKTDFREAALRLAKNGFRVFPLPAGQKAARLAGWQKKATVDLAQIERWWAGANTACNIGLVPTGDVFVLDEDPKNGGDKTLVTFEQTYGPLPATLTAKTPSGGRHLYFQTPGGLPTGSNKLGAGLDIRGRSTGYVVAPPSITVAGEKQSAGQYTWAEKAAIAVAPEWLTALVLQPKVSNTGAVLAEALTSTPSQEGAGSAGTASAFTPLSADELRDALDLIPPPEKGERDQWLRIGMAVKDWNGAEAFAIWDAWCARAKTGYDAATQADAWNSFDSGTHEKRVTVASLVKEAKAAGWSRGSSAASADEFEPITDVAEPTNSPRKRSVLKLIRGDEHKQVDETIEKLASAGELYDQDLGDGCARLVRPRDGHLVPVSADWLRNYVGNILWPKRFDVRTQKWSPTAVPRDLVDAVLAQHDHGVPKLEAVIIDAVMRADGSVLSEPGYSERDRLLLDATETTVVPEAPSDAQMRAAFAELWLPFKDFPFVDATARGVLLSALLTTAVRPSIGTAPAYAFDAPVAATGKTLLAQCVALMTGSSPPIEAPPLTDDEANKKLFAALRGGARVVLWDNYTQSVRGDSAVCAFLTAPYYTSRVLGISKIETLPNKALLILTGNNLRVTGDACRRVLLCRIDSDLDRPSLRTFDLAPAAYVHEHRRALRVAVLTLLRGFQSRGAPKQTDTTAGSFEDWDKLVRQCVIWLGKSTLAGIELDDPYLTAIASIDDDPDAELVGSVLHAWHGAFGNHFTSVGEAWKAAYSDDIHVPELREALEGISGDDRGFNMKRLGFWLQKHRNTPVDGLRLASSRDTRTRSWTYAVLQKPTNILSRPEDDPLAA